MHPSDFRCVSASFAVVMIGFSWLAQTPPALAQSAAKPAASIPASDRFSTEAAAASHCPNDKVVWSSFSKSKVFHDSGSKYFGKTRHGAYVCEKVAVAAGYHASKR